MKKLIVFDLDGTLAESKLPLDMEMAELLQYLLAITKVAVISGGDWPQFEKQFLANFTNNRYNKNLFLLPTCGTKFYKYVGNWQKIYSEDLTDNEKRKIISSIQKVLEDMNFKIDKVWGAAIEDRGSQITFSALGQQAPLKEKKKWDPDFTKRKKIKAGLDPLIPEFSIQLGGTTSVDVTKKNINKAYGIKKLHDVLKIPIYKMLFIGDALFPGGNDYTVEKTGVMTINVKNASETKRVIETIIACMRYD